MAEILLVLNVYKLRLRSEKAMVKLAKKDILFTFRLMRVHLLFLKLFILNGITCCFLRLIHHREG